MEPVTPRSSIAAAKSPLFAAGSPASPDAWTAWARGCITQADLAPLDELVDLGPAPDEPRLASESEIVRILVDARVHHRAGDYARSRTLLDRARARFEQLAAAPAWLGEWMELWFAHHAYARGSFSDASRRYARALSAFERSGDIAGASAAVRGLGNVAKYFGLYAQAAEHYDRAIELARACGDAVGSAAAEHNHGNVLMSLGEPRAAATAFRRAIRAFGRARRPDLVRHAMMSLASARHEQGRHEEALRLLALAAPPASARQIHEGDEAERLIAVAMAESGLRRFADALRSLTRAARLARACGESHTEALVHRASASLLLESGAPPARALAAARRGLRATAKAKSPTEITAELHELAARASEQCGDWQEAARHFQKAFATQRRFASQRHREHAESVALHRELAQARHQAEMARVENVRLSEALAQIAARLESGDTRHPPAAQAGDIDPAALRGLGLRPREAEVLLWLIQGKSNVEIATILGCSAETVKSHLKRIYAQLDVTNRTAAAASALARIGT
jgi:DNA-binding CsgD family transcriptional regulator